MFVRSEYYPVDDHSKIIYDVHYPDVPSLRKEWSGRLDIRPVQGVALINQADAFEQYRVEVPNLKPPEDETMDQVAGEVITRIDEALERLRVARKAIREEYLAPQNTGIKAQLEHWYSEIGGTISLLELQRESWAREYPK